MVTDILRTTQLHKPVLITAGFFCILRGILWLNSPNYWDPRTPLDYTAAVSTSLTFLFLGFSLWVFSLRRPVQPSLGFRVYRTALTVACVAAFAISLGNFFEDVLMIRSLGIVWVAGILALTAGMLTAGISAFWVRGLPRWVGVLLLGCTGCLLFIGSWGWFGMGFALLALSVWSI